MTQTHYAQSLINTLLDAAEAVSFRLEAAGIDAPHRHDIVAMLANSQVRLDGELQSLEARYAQLKVQANRILGTSEQLLQSAAGLVLFPGLYLIQRLQGKESAE
jgi:hypothetical protein